MTKWEYDTAIIDPNQKDSMAVLQYQGRQGWELVSVISENSSYHTFVFKRPIVVIPK